MAPRASLPKPISAEPLPDPIPDPQVDGRGAARPVARRSWQSDQSARRRRSALPRRVGKVLICRAAQLAAAPSARRRAAAAYGSRPVLWVRGEYLAWWADGMYVPPLVVRGDVGDPGTPAIRPTIFSTMRSSSSAMKTCSTASAAAARLRVGYWLDDYGQTAIEGEYFGFGQIDDGFVDGGDGTFPIVGRPVHRRDDRIECGGRRLVSGHQGNGGGRHRQHVPISRHRHSSQPLLRQRATLAAAIR